jgi:hypothetical protein
MATVTKCFKPIRGRALRVAKLDSCGVPVTGNAVVITGFVQVQQTAEYETGDEHIVKLADASLCINEKDPDILKRLTLTIDLCQIDPGLPSLMGVARMLTASESPTGTGFAVAEGAATARFSLEVWQDSSGAAACSGGSALYVYNAWPNLGQAKIGDYQISIAESTLQLIAESKAVNTAWSIGNTWLGSGAVSAVQDHWFMNLTTAAPPTPACGLSDVAA